MNSESIVQEHGLDPSALATRLELRSPVGRLRVLLPLAFLGAGISLLVPQYFLFDELATVPPSAPWGIPASAIHFLHVDLLLTLTLIGAASCAAGLYFLGARSGIVFDREAQTVTVWWAWLSRRRSTVHDLRSFAAVSVTTKAEDPITFFPSAVKSPCAGPLHLIFLVGPPGPKIPIATVKGPRQCADDFADQVASFLSSPQTAGAPAPGTMPLQSCQEETGR